MRHDDTRAYAEKSDERLRLVSVVADLPADFAVMRAEAGAEGHLFLERLAADWQSRAIRFDRSGEALLAAFCNEVLAGVGGVTIDPVMPDGLRMRRFYVRAPFRRCGIGRKLASALLETAQRTGRPITVNAAPASTPFWESVGFKPDSRDGHTHILDLHEL